jgi:hypothetical protein
MKRKEIVRDLHSSKYKQRVVESKKRKTRKELKKEELEAKSTGE